jgi:hypothetical protein
LLGGGEFAIENDNVGLEFVGDRGSRFRLAASDIEGAIGHRPRLYEGANNARSGCSGEFRQLVQRFSHLPGFVAGGLHPDKNSLFLSA